MNGDTSPRLLVINSGSSSLKYQLIDARSEILIASGLIERIGEEGSDSDSASGRVADHVAAFRVMLAEMNEQGIDLAERLLAIGHRVVHGGERFLEPTLVTEEVKQQIDELTVLAPLHNPPNLAGIVAAETAFPGVPQVAVFDTAFHRTLPAAARTYAVNADLAQRHGIRRFGFHGISFDFVAGEAARVLGRTLGDVKLIVLHLGNGASACAIDGGRSVETSMGLTPLEGLMMGTRGGDIDPGALVHLQREAGLSVAELDELLNYGSGLLGLGGFGDIRDVQNAAMSGDERAALAIEVYEHRIRGYVGAYFAQLGRVDAVVFTAGVGENNAALRAGALDGLEVLGIQIDAELNESSSRAARTISTPTSRVAVLVVPTNEEREIARQALALVSSAPRG